MRKVFMLFLLLGTLMACTKRERVKPIQCFVSGVMGGHTDALFTIDQNGKISKIVDESDGSEFRTTLDFAYGPNSIIVKRTQLSKGNSTTQDIEYVLDGSGKIISSSKGYIVYYNTDGYVSEIQVGKLIDQFTYANDNLVMVRTNYGNSYTSSISLDYDVRENYTAYTVDPPTLADIELKALYEQGFFGNRSRRAVKSTSSGTENYNYNYEKDTNGNVIRVVARGNTKTNNIVLSYQCQ